MQIWIPVLQIGEKRAEVKAANPDYKIGDIAKVCFFWCIFAELLFHVTDFFLNRNVAGYRADVEGAGRERKGNGRAYVTWLILVLKAPYEKKAEAAKKKYAQEMAAYEASKWPWLQFGLDLYMNFLK